MKSSFKIPFYLGCASLLILAIIHLISHFALPLVAANKNQESLLALYNSIPFQLPLDQKRTLNEIMNGYSLYFPTLLIGFVALLLISAQNNVVLKSALHATLTILLILITITYVYMITPPLIMMCFSAVCFLLSLRALNKGSNP